MTDSDEMTRLDRLEGYLRQDPANPELLADTFDAALRAAAWERAEFHLRHAQALGLDRAAWSLRESHWLLAQHRWPEARERLTELQSHVSAAGAGEDERRVTVAADLAYVHLREGNPVAGIAVLEGIVEGTPAGAAIDASVETLWLRLLHGALDPERAMSWLLRREAAAPALRPQTAGVASLIALDVGDYASSLRWSSAALREPTPVIEARVARASLALGEGNALQALQLLELALPAHGEDGRVLSALAFARLLDEDIPAARDTFERAVALLSGHVGTWHGLGWTALVQGDLPAARHAFETALAIDRNFAESHGAMAVVGVMQGDAAGAREAIAVADRLDRTNLAARYAEALLGGDARDAVSLHRLASRLLCRRRTPLGNEMGEVLRVRRQRG